METHFAYITFILKIRLRKEKRVLQLISQISFFIQWTLFFVAFSLHVPNGKKIGPFSCY